MTNKNKYKKLYKYYNKELLKCHKLNFNNFSNNIDYFITYLRFMRDTYILNAEKYDIQENIKIASLFTALTEYALYNDCINNYYTINNNYIMKKDAEKTAEEVDEEYRKEKQQHWMNFWTVVCANMEGWFEINDYTI